MYTLTHHIVSLPTSQYIQEFRNPEKFISFCRQCERYNRCWACPPFEFNTDEYLSGYQQTYIIGTKIAFDTATRDSCTTLEEHKTISLQTIESVRKIIDPRLLTLEDEYSGSRAFYAGTCQLCPQNSCTRINGHPCLHPQEIRPSLESVGFDISKTTSELLHIELQWSNDAHLPEYLTLVSGLFTKESAYTPISTRISSLLTV